MPDEFPRLKQEARGGFGYAVNSCEFLWNDSEKWVVIGVLILFDSKLHLPDQLQNCFSAAR